MNRVELIGMLASFCVLLSMCFKTNSFKQTVAMRSINILGSIIFVIYGLLLPAYSTAIMNALLVIVNTYHIILLIRGKE